MSIVLATVAICFALFHAVSNALVGGLGTSKPGTTPRAHMLRRIAGLALFGIVPAMVAATALPHGLAGVGLGLGDPLRAAGAVSILGLIAMPILWQATSQTKLQAQYPQIRVQEWDRNLYAASSLTWAAYLLGYEFMFRGFLLFALIEPLGMWPAIWLNVALYVAVHADKDSQEVIACVPMGVLFCALALWTGAIWAPFLLHVIIALTSETGAIVQRPDTDRWAILRSPHTYGSHHGRKEPG